MPGGGVLGCWLYEKCPDSTNCTSAVCQAVTAVVVASLMKTRVREAVQCLNGLRAKGLLDLAARGGLFRCPTGRRVWYDSPTETGPR